ncbi:hypothetical protein SAMN06296427_10212 [Moheibacter sediminis]|uniref:Uncharacterized protein n=2 Tax=Moheibacter sediminis TaxID=1434700 RepID=A0A1W1YXF6_9FLAO|nr:hypothetical protein SAMN06296427_10212 [Moheibacter sediminis]
MKSVLFIYRNQNLAQAFVKHFRLNNYNVYEFYDEPISYFKFNLFQKIENLVYKKVFKDNKHLHEINERNFINHTNRSLKKLKRLNLKFDYCFVIRGDLIPENALKYAQDISGKMVDYQLDGIKVSQKILDYYYLFDKVFVFDESDVANYPEYNFTAITNCYFEDKIQEEKIIDFYYTGAYLPDRFENLKEIINYSGTEFNYKILLGAFRNMESPKEIEIITEPITYEENLQYAKRAKILLDFKREEHDGLSLRFFEAMNYNCKVITNNHSVKNYDFYNPDNIFITDFINFDGLEEFIKKRYQSIPSDIKSKYEFKSWISNILEDA